jgi:predicted ferric reductase
VLWLVLIHGLVSTAGWVNGALAGPGVTPVLAAGQITGLFLASCGLLQLLLASRAPWLEHAYGLDGLTRLHHRVGQAFLVPLIAHPLLVTWNFMHWSGESVFAAYASLLAMDGVVSASIALCLLLGILVYSVIQPWTSWNYQWWYAVHLAMYAAVRAVPPGTRVVLEGPYGIFTSARGTSPRVLCLAFGIGITPIRTIAEDLVNEGRDVVLVYGSVRSDEIALRHEVEGLSSRSGMQVHHVLSEEHLPPLPPSGHLPRVTVSGGFVTRDYLRRVVPDVAERDVFLCGPPVVMRMLRKDLAALGVPAGRIFAEQFSLQ